MNHASKRVIDQMFGHGPRSVFDQNFQDGHPTGVADQTLFAVNQSPEKAAGVVDAVVVPVIPVDGFQPFGHKVHRVAIDAGRFPFASGDDDVIDQPVTKLSVRSTRSHRCTVDDRSRGH